MFIIRQAQPGDVDDLHALAKQTFFINLPPDRDIIAHKIEQSARSFRGVAGGGAGRKKGAGAGAGGARLRSSSASSHNSGHREVTGRGDLFLFVLENLDARGRSGGVVGTSQIIARMGGPGHPRYFMSLDTVANQSRSLGIGWTHLVGRMGKDETGPTEIGGLILNHAFRGHPERLGRFLSFVRFHFIGLYRKQFADTIIAEMLGPITRTGYNPFYEKFTRHFVTRAFADVYRFSQTSREFLEALMPKGDVYLSILDPEVANAAGEVGDDTRPARKLLERLGFEYHKRIDPLDGGPHLEAKTDRIALVKATRRVQAFDGMERVAGRRSRSGAGGAGGGDHGVIASVLDRNGHFQAVQTIGKVGGQRASLEAGASEALSVGDVFVRGATVVGE